jgi:hypothetical protein
VLDEADWELEEREGETIRRSPEDGTWYEPRSVVETIRDGEDTGSVG